MLRHGHAEHHCEARSGSNRREIDAGFSAVHAGYFTIDHQTQTTAFRTIVQDAVETFEDTFTLFIRDTRAIIGD